MPIRTGFAGLLILGLLSGCGGGGGGVGPVGSNSSSLQAPPTGMNVMTVSMGGSGICNKTSTGEVPNNPCTSVVLCEPGTSNCVTIPEILVDSGSTGLRVFKSALPQSFSLPPVADSQGNPIAECVGFADTTALWGGVNTADVVLGGEPAVRVPIQVVDPGFLTSSGFAGTTACGSGFTVIQSPDDAAANGILGIDFFKYDPGPYFDCNTSTRSCSSYPYSSMLTPVEDPIFLLPRDNNGVIFNFPSIPSTGSASVTGYLLLGIGTTTNNGIGSGLSVYPANGNTGAITTFFNGTAYTGYVDSGTNGIVIPDSSIPSCSNGDGFLCPAGTESLFAYNVNGHNSQIRVNFQIANADGLFNSGNLVFNDLGIASIPSFGLIWGSPFFFGRVIYFGHETMSSPLGTGPLYAF